MFSNDVHNVVVELAFLRNGVIRYSLLPLQPLSMVMYFPEAFLTFLVSLRHIDVWESLNNLLLSQRGLSCVRCRELCRSKNAGFSAINYAGEVLPYFAVVVILCICCKLPRPTMPSYPMTTVVLKCVCLACFTLPWAVHWSMWVLP